MILFDAVRSLVAQYSVIGVADLILQASYVSYFILLSNGLN